MCMTCILNWNLCSEHQELSRQIQHCTDARLHEDLDRELDALVARMEAKGDQIGRLRRHQQGV
jgi:centrosomal protein CEP57